MTKEHFKFVKIPVCTIHDLFHILSKKEFMHIFIRMEFLLYLNNTCAAYRFLCKIQSAFNWTTINICKLYIYLIAPSK